MKFTSNTMDFKSRKESSSADEKCDLLLIGNISTPFRITIAQAIYVTNKATDRIFIKMRNLKITYTLCYPLK